MGHSNGRAGESDAPRRFVPIARPEIPPLAWLLSFETPTPTLYHGSGVDVFDRGFFEGCFAGEYGSDPRLAANVFGSGMWHADDVWHVIPPSHTLESVFVMTENGARGVSNSLPFLLEHFGQPAPTDLDWSQTMLTVAHGIDHYRRRLLAAGGREVCRYVFRNLRVTAHGRVEEVDKVRDDTFDTYATYVGYLQRVLSNAFANATDPRRPGRYAPIGAMSSGYDSSASTALAVRAGCTEGLTIAQARLGGNDSGKPVGDALGITVHEYDRPQSGSVAFDQLAEFFVPGTSGSDYIYHVFEQRLHQRTLLSGTYGDKVWRPDVHAGATLTRASLDGTSFHEFRLRSNFLHIPVPMIGGRQHARIREIARSSEMRAWSVAGDYDAPVARRILEEMGVPRTAFGQQKRAAGLPLTLGQRLGPPRTTQHWVSPAVVREIEQRAGRIGIRRTSVDYRRRLGMWHARYGLALAVESVAGRIEPIQYAFGDRIYLQRVLARQEHPETSVMALVSLDAVRRRYARPHRDAERDTEACAHDR